MGFGLPRWETDRDFSIHNHFERITLPEPCDHTALAGGGGRFDEPAARSGSTRSGNSSLPIWKTAARHLICRLHHCIADGMALVQVLLSTADVHPDDEAPPDDMPPIELETARLAGPGVKACPLCGSCCRQGFPGGRWPGAGRACPCWCIPAGWAAPPRWGSAPRAPLGKLLFIPPDRKTSLRGKCGMEKRAAWSVAIELEEVKGIGG